MQSFPTNRHVQAPLQQICFENSVANVELFTTLFNYNTDCSFNYRECPYFLITANALKDICCRGVVCEKGLTK